MGKKLNSYLMNKTGDIASVAGWLWQRGWAERNAGNISVRIDETDISGAPDHDLRPKVPLDRSFASLRGSMMLVTATNTRMRDVAANPLDNILLIRITDSGDAYSVIFPEGATALRPTSELMSHLLIHEMLSVKKPDHRVVIHAHVTELIALTQIKQLCDAGALNRILLGMHPEVAIFIPGGAGFVPYQLPGTTAIGEATVTNLEDHDAAIWEKHGVFATGKTPGETFDTIDLLAKSAAVWFLCRSTGVAAEGLSEKQFDDLSKIKF